MIRFCKNYGVGLAFVAAGASAPRGDGAMEGKNNSFLAAEDSISDFQSAHHDQDAMIPKWRHGANSTIIDVARRGIPAG